MLQVWPVFEEIEGMFRATLEERGPLHLARVSWFRRDPYSPNVEVRGYWRAYDGQEWAKATRFNTLDVTSRGRLSGRAFNLGRDLEGDLDYQSLWSRMAEDFRMQQAAREQDNALRVLARHVLARLAPSPQAYEQFQVQAQVLREHVERHHQEVRIPLDAQSFNVSGLSTATEVNFRRHIQERAIREMSERFDRMALNLLQGQATATSTADAAPDLTITVESVRQALETLARNGTHDAPYSRPGMTYMGVDPGMDPGRVEWRPGHVLLLPERDVGTKEARDKGKKLLLENLSPEQKAEYEKTSAFTVTAPSGTRYRIREGRQMNIDVLDRNGNRKSGICFLPEGQLVAGDCMLAQKIALETCEELAMSVANKFA